MRWWGRTGLCCRRTIGTRYWRCAVAAAAAAIAAAAAAARSTARSPHDRIASNRAPALPPPQVLRSPHDLIVEGLLPTRWYKDFQARGLTAERMWTQARGTSHHIPITRHHHHSIHPSHVISSPRSSSPTPTGASCTICTRRTPRRFRCTARPTTAPTRRRRGAPTPPPPAETTLGRRCRARGARASRCRRRCR